MEALLCLLGIIFGFMLCEVKHRIARNWAREVSELFSSMWKDILEKRFKLASDLKEKGKKKDA